MQTDINQKHLLLIVFSKNAEISGCEKQVLSLSIAIFAPENLFTSGLGGGHFWRESEGMEKDFICSEL